MQALTKAKSGTFWKPNLQGEGTLKCKKIFGGGCKEHAKSSGRAHAWPRIAERTSKRKFYSTSTFEWTSTGEPRCRQLAVSIRFRLDKPTMHKVNSMRSEWRCCSNSHFLRKSTRLTHKCCTRSKFQTHFYQDRKRANVSWRRSKKASSVLVQLEHAKTHAISEAGYVMWMLRPSKTT